MAPSPVLSVSGLEKAFGRTRILEGLDLAVGPGAFVVLLGPPGAGKSTFVRLLAGLAAPDRGRAAIAGHDVVAARSRAAAAAGFVFEEPSLDLRRSIRANLLYEADLRGLPRAEARRAIAAALARLGLRVQDREAAHVLGPTNRRRLELARAALGRPSLLVADCVSTGLDASGRSTVLADARALAGPDGRSVLWLTDRPDEAVAGDRVLILKRGRAAFDGPQEALAGIVGAADFAAAYHAFVADEAALGS